MAITHSDADTKGHPYWVDQPHFFVFNIGILVKLGQPFIEPKRQPGVRMAQHIMRVLVVHNRIWVVTPSIKPQQNVTPALRLLKITSQVEFSFAKVILRLQGLKTLFVFYC